MMFMGEIFNRAQFADLRTSIENLGRKNGKSEEEILREIKAI